MKVEFVIDGEAKGKARPRVTGTGHAYTPAKTVEYENYVRLCYKQQCGDTVFEGPLRATINILTSIPMSASKKKRKLMRDGVLRPMKKPDIDNIVKAILDSLNGIAYHDDSCVVECLVFKWYSDFPKVDVCLDSLDTQD